MPLPIFSLFSKRNESIGEKGERVAGEYLKKKGYRVLERNYRNPKGQQLGEIDIVAEKDGAIVFVEVKAREGKQGETFPEDNITPSKLRKLEKIAVQYLRARKKAGASYHFDAIAIVFDGNHASTRHFEHIFF